MAGIDSLLVALAQSQANGSGGGAPAGGGAAGIGGAVAAANPYGQAIQAGTQMVSQLGQAALSQPADNLNQTTRGTGAAAFIGSQIGGGDITTGGARKSAAPTLLIVLGALAAVGVVAFIALRRA